MARVCVGKVSQGSPLHVGRSANELRKAGMHTELN